MEENQKIKIGIIGTGRIAKRFIPELQMVDGIELTGVYTPHIESGQAFANQFQILYWKTKEEFFSKVDAVYIASPHKTHIPYVMEALSARKHVLCEKPMALQEEDATRAITLAEQNHLVVLEGIKTAYAPGYQKVLELIHSGVIGKVGDVEACFTKLEQKEKRELTDLETGGSFLELGTYPLLPILDILGEGYTELRFQQILAENGLDLYTKASFSYPNAMGEAKVGLGYKSEGELVIAGEKGYIRVEAPWWKPERIQVCFEDRSQNQRYQEEFLGDGLRYEITFFRDIIKALQKDKEKIGIEEENRQSLFIEYQKAGRRSIQSAKVIEQFLQEKDKRKRGKEKSILSLKKEDREEGK